jgi:hypothetical protein
MKTLKVALIVFLIVLFISCDDTNSDNDMFDIETEDLEIQQDDLEIMQEDIDIIQADLDLKFEANAVLNSISRNKFVLTLYLRDVNKDEIPSLTENNVFAYIKYKDKYFHGKPEVNNISQTNQNIATSLIMDYSGSMFDNYLGRSNTNRYIIEKLEKAATSFITNFDNNDNGQIIKFGSNIDILTELINDKSALNNSITAKSFERGGTALYDAIDKGVIELQKIDRKKYSPAIVAFTDGVDEHSNLDINYVINNANSNKLPVFTVGLQSNSFDPKTLQNISKMTGGFYYNANNPEELTDLYNKINKSIRNSYRIQIVWNGSKLPNKGEKAEF